MKTPLKFLLVLLAFFSFHTVKAQTGNCNLINSFNVVDTSFCETIFYPDIFDPSNSYYWDFGDGNTSNTAYTVNQYSIPGTYNVTVIVSDSVCSDTITQSVVILQCTPPCNIYASFTKFDSACYTGFQPSPYDTSYTFMWDFGDGNTSTDLEPLHLYTAIGTYNVTLIVSNANCSDTVMSQITSSNCNAPCLISADFYDYDTSCYTGFYPTPINASYSYSWDFGDGNSSSMLIPEHLYAIQGNYNVTLIVSDGICADTITKNISSASCNTPCNITADFYDYDTSCYTGFYPTPLDFSLSYSWDFGDGNSSSMMNPEHLYATQGNYNVSLIISDGTCADTITKTISSASCNTSCNLDASFTVNGTSGYTYTFTPNVITSTNNYTWYFDDGTISNNTIETHTFANANTYAVMLSVTDSLCSDIDTVFVTVVDSSSNLNSSFNYMQEDDGSFTFSPNYDISNYDNFIWDFGDNSTSTAIEPNHMYSANGNYMILLTVNNGNYTSTDTLNLSITSLGIDQNEKSLFEINLYPNPASEIVNLEFNAVKPETFEISIVDLNGKILNQESFNALQGENLKELEINSISKGVYQVMLRNENGTLLERIRFVKQ